MNPIFVMLQYVLLFFQFAIIGRAILSWFDRGMQNPISQMLYQITEPIIAPIRQIMPRTGMIDLSPLIALIIIIVLQRMLVAAAAA